MQPFGAYISPMSNSIRKIPAKPAESLASSNKIEGGDTDVREEVKKATEWVMRRYEQTLKALAK
ncbi:hypothetical protein AUP43_12110 [Oceanibaculum pacificum]|uniref:Uncharacterized protein n=1 Tax=Oceanibaculum pacificum TaxID=580166 RepID=A0A154VUL0_9PROT|nr:hypothetical protein AUP43_12110 [Oceanibaculum pacificum]